MSSEISQTVAFDFDGQVSGEDIQQLASEAPAYMYIRNVEDPEPDRITISSLDQV